MNFLEKSLFDTGAIKVADAMTPFWYTSGTIGPFFINTHYLYGSRKDADSLLKFIDGNLENKEFFVKEIHNRVLDFYKNNSLFKKIIDIFYENIRDNCDFIKSEFISGGERRDWFFSPIIANLSGKKPLYIFKNLDVYSLNGKVADLNNSYAAHIADLINHASSYERAWIPAIKKINGNLIFSASVVDRSQGGQEFLLANKINCFSSVIADDDFFKDAMENNVINNDQFLLIKQFVSNPDEYGKNFLNKYPEYLRSSLYSSDKSIRSKAERCIKENPYGMDFTKMGL